MRPAARASCAGTSSAVWERSRPVTRIPRAGDLIDRGARHACRGSSHRSACARLQRARSPVHARALPAIIHGLSRRSSRRARNVREISRLNRRPPPPLPIELPDAIVDSLLKQFAQSSQLGANAGYIEDLYEQYLVAPDSVGPKWKAYFDGFKGREAGDVPHSAVIDAIAAGRHAAPRAALRGAADRHAATTASARSASWSPPTVRAATWPPTSIRSGMAAKPDAPDLTLGLPPPVRQRPRRRIQHRRRRRPRAHEAARPASRCSRPPTPAASAPSSCTSPTPNSVAGCTSAWKRAAGNYGRTPKEQGAHPRAPHRRRRPGALPAHQVRRPEALLAGRRRQPDPDARRA